MKKFSLILGIMLILGSFSLFATRRNIEIEQTNLQEQYSKSDYVQLYKNYHSRADSLHGFDVTNYDITISIDDENHFIEGSVIADVTAEESLNFIEFELESLDVNSVLFNGLPTTYTHENGIIHIDIETVLPNEEFTITVDYSGNPIISPTYYGTGMFFIAGGIFTISDPNGSRYWWPCYDHPWDKAEVDLHITCREDWTAACNGIRTSIVDNGDGTKTHHWDGENPMATYLVSIVARIFTELNDSYEEIPIQNFVSPSQVTNATEDFINLPFMMEVYSNLYGDYPFEKYGNAVTSFATYGAMEHQTMTTLSSSMITGNHGDETIIAHELSHQWFGDCLTALTWKDIWLSEGFATYSEALYTEEWQGYEAMIAYVYSSFHSYYKNWAGSNTYTTYAPADNAIFTPATYEKPASVLHMLRMIVGDETFFEILQTYFETYKNSNVVSEEFIEVCEQISGLDLSQFFLQWIYQPGLPNSETAIFISEDSQNPQALILSKTGSNCETDFYLNFPVRITHENGDFEDILAIGYPDDYHSTIVSINDNEYSSIEVDPDNWVLARWQTKIIPEISLSFSSDGKITLVWNEFLESADLDGYNVYRSETENGEFVKINSELITETSFTDTGLENGQTYYYKLAAEKDGFISENSMICSASPMTFLLDEGILIIDETQDGNGAVIAPNDETVDEYYRNILNAEVSEYDIATEGSPSLELLSHYSTVIYHDDDFSMHYINDAIVNLISYSMAGGNLIISGWKTASEIDQNYLDVSFNIDNSELVYEYEFQGADSENYSNLLVNPDKTLPNWNGTLPWISIFPESEFSFYTYNGIENSAYEGSSVGMKSSGEGNFVLLGFPLYFMNQDNVQSLVNQLLNEFGEPTENNYQVNNEIIFSTRNYPNPFNPQTIIEYSIPNDGLVDISIYNLKGQLVRHLLSEKVKAGIRKIKWDGIDDYNKDVSSGIYFYKVRNGSFTATRKIILLK